MRRANVLLVGAGSSGKSTVAAHACARLCDRHHWAAHRVDCRLWKGRSIGRALTRATMPHCCRQESGDRAEARIGSTGNVSAPRTGGAAARQHRRAARPTSRRLAVGAHVARQARARSVLSPTLIDYQQHHADARAGLDALVTASRDGGAPVRLLCTSSAPPSQLHSALSPAARRASIDALVHVLTSLPELTEVLFIRTHRHGDRRTGQRRDEAEAK